ncbi:MAG: MFS transporter, partial [Candidatus Hodarchaeales archaeon]
SSLIALFISYCLTAFASSQASGTLQTWIDNNYKISAGEADPDREIYRFFTGRWNMTNALTRGISFVIGGFLATMFSRQIVFGIQAILLVLLGISFIFYINDFPEVQREERSVRNYFRLLGGGLEAVFLNQSLLLFIIGMCLQATTWMIWAQMILLPMYFGYTGSDGLASLYRFSIFIALIPIAGIAANFAAKLNIKWHPVLLAIHTGVFFTGMIFITALFPFKNRFEPVALILL